MFKRYHQVFNKGTSLHASEQPPQSSADQNPVMYRLIFQNKIENNTLVFQLKMIYFGYEKKFTKKSFAHILKNLPKPAMVEDTYPSLLYYFKH